MPPNHTRSDRQLALMLSALRLLQRSPDHNDVLRMHLPEAADITPTEIDSLCEALNFADEAETLDRETMQALTDAAKRGILDMRVYIEEGYAETDGCDGEYNEALERFEAAHAKAVEWLSKANATSVAKDGGPDERPAVPALYKTTITLWTDYDPEGVGIDDLARDAVSGDAYQEGLHARRESSQQSRFRRYGLFSEN